MGYFNPQSSRNSRARGLPMFPGKAPPNHCAESIAGTLPDYSPLATVLVLGSLQTKGLRNMPTS